MPGRLRFIGKGKDGRSNSGVSDLHLQPLTKLQRRRLSKQRVMIKNIQFRRIVLVCITFVAGRWSVHFNFWPQKVEKHDTVSSFFEANENNTPTTNTNEVEHYEGVSALRAIVTGLEHSGTTIASQIMFNAPCMIGALETGFLLADTPADIEGVRPWIDWHRKPNNLLFYNLTDDDIGAMKQATDFGEMFDILRNTSHLFNVLKDEPYCQRPYQMIDKTPRYAYPNYFEKVIVKTPGVPVFVLKKPYEKLKKSWDRRNATLVKEGYDGVYKNVENVMAKYPNRTIRIIDYDELMSDPSSIMKDVYAILGRAWNPSYLNMAHLQFKLSECCPNELNFFERRKFRGGQHSLDIRDNDVK